MEHVSMWKAFIAWWREMRRLGDLRAEYLRERDQIVCANAFSELEEEYDVAMEQLTQKYIALGLTREDIVRTDAYHPYVRIE